MGVNDMSREMKDSGVEWIGEIPKNWNVQRVKNAFVRKKAEAHQENPVVLSLARPNVIPDFTRKVFLPSAALYRTTVQR